MRAIVSLASLLPPRY